MGNRSKGVLAIALLFVMVSVEGCSSPKNDEEEHSYDLSSYGISVDGIVVLEFGSKLCSYCRAQVNELKKIHDEFGDKVEIFTVLIGPRDDPDAYKKDNGLEWRVKTDSDLWNKVREDFGARGIPTTLILKDGNVACHWIGLIRSGDLKQKIEDLLGD